MRAEAAELLEKAEGLERLADHLEREVGSGKPPPRGPLHGRVTETTLATEMEAIAHTREQRISRARLAGENRDHPFVQALVERGIVVKDFARQIGYAPSTVTSWYAKNPVRARPIPAEAAEKIRELLGVPMSAWRKITP